MISPAATRSPSTTVGSTGSTVMSRAPALIVTSGRSTTTPAKCTMPLVAARTGAPCAVAARSTPR
jgi:hypothetical protein